MRPFALVSLLKAAAPIAQAGAQTASAVASVKRASMYVEVVQAVKDVFKPAAKAAPADTEEKRGG